MNDPLRLSCKVFEKDGKRYMLPVGWYNPATDTFQAVGLAEEGTTTITITPEEWNALPYFWFKEDGEAPKPEHRKITLPERVRR